MEKETEEKLKVFATKRDKVLNTFNLEEFDKFISESEFYEKNITDYILSKDEEFRMRIMCKTILGVKTLYPKTIKQAKEWLKSHKKTRGKK